MTNVGRKPGWPRLGSSDVFDDNGDEVGSGEDRDDEGSSDDDVDSGDEVGGHGGSEYGSGGSGDDKVVVVILKVSMVVVMGTWFKIINVDRLCSVETDMYWRGMTIFILLLLLF